MIYHKQISLEEYWRLIELTFWKFAGYSHKLQVVFGCVNFKFNDHFVLNTAVALQTLQLKKLDR